MSPADIEADAKGRRATAEERRDKVCIPRWRGVRLGTVLIICVHACLQVMGGRKQFEHKMHGGGLNNSEKQRGKNAAMVQRSRKIRDKTQSSKQGRRGTNTPKCALKHDAKKRRRA